MISCETPEFTCLCPRSGFPDLATISLRYVPDHSIVELKSLKLYINRYRNEHAFHEAVINQICNDLIAYIDPRWIEVAGDFNVRGNIRTVVTVVHARPDYRLPDYLSSVSKSRGRTNAVTAAAARRRAPSSRVCWRFAPVGTQTIRTQG